nr:hypothetical protein KXZ65_20350 [Pectobacterium sp. PL152]
MATLEYAKNIGIDTLSDIITPLKNGSSLMIQGKYRFIVVMMDSICGPHPIYQR